MVCSPFLFSTRQKTLFLCGQVDWKRKEKRVWGVERRVRKAGAKIFKMGGWSSFQQEPHKAGLRFNVVTLTSTKELCVSESCRRHEQRKLLSFDIQIIFKYSNKKLVLYSPPGFLSTSSPSPPSSFLCFLWFVSPSAPPLSMFLPRLILREMQLEGYFDSHRQGLD